MADETNENDDTPETGEVPETTGDTPTADTPTEETAAVDDAPAAAAEETEPAVTAPATPPDVPAQPTRERSYVRVPTWAAAVVGAIVAVVLLGGGGFVLGRETADDGGTDTEAISVPSTDQFPRVFPLNPDEQPRGVARAFFGVSVETADGGVAVLRVSSGSPAEDAGFKEGDVITKVDGKDVSTPAEFADAIHAHEPGDRVEITYTRDGSTNETTVQLQDRLEQSTPNN